MNPKPLITILRRSLKSQYKTFLLNNRMMMQCYTIDEDDDIGFKQGRKPQCGWEY